MKRSSLLMAGLLGGLTGLVIICLTYLGNQFFGLPFVPFNIFDWMARHFPGGLINFFIDTNVKVITALKLGPTASTAKLVEQSVALVQFVVLGILIGGVLWLIGRRRA